MKTTTLKQLNLKALPLLILALAFILLPHTAHAASTYTVNSIGDDPDVNPGDLVCETATPGECTLRAAIQEVNAGSGGDTINFGIAGSGVHTLTPATCYPTIAQSVTIDGYSQPGSSANTNIAPAGLNSVLKIELDGSGAGTCNGLSAVSSGNINFTIKGLVVRSFEVNGISIGDNVDANINGNFIGTNSSGTVSVANLSDGISIDGENSFTVGGLNPEDRNLVSGNGAAGIGLRSTAPGTKLVQGNLVGTDVTGVTAVANQVGIRLTEIGNATIGGTAAGSKNVTSGNTSSGILLNNNSSFNTIQGNYIGVDVGGAGSLPNGAPGAIAENSGSDNVIGGNTAAARNIISNGPGVNGILLFSTANISIQGNYIGTDKDGDIVPGLGNAFGVFVVNGSFNNIVGGLNSGEANKIAGNDTGVSIMTITGFGPDPLNNSIIGNDIEQNASSGIRLCNDTNTDFQCDTPEPYPNDAGDPDEGPNMSMNYPVINTATKGTGQVTVNYDLDINPAEVGATGYSVDFYANSTNAREGAIYLGSDIVPGSVTGQSVTLTLPGSVPADYYVTAVTTMTDVSADGYGHSSEFSAPVQAIAASPTPGPTPTPSPSETSSSSLANTGQPQHTNQRLFIALALIAAGVLGIAGLKGQRIYIKRRKSRV